MAARSRLGARIPVAWAVAGGWPFRSYVEMRYSDSVVAGFENLSDYLARQTAGPRSAK